MTCCVQGFNSHVVPDGKLSHHSSPSLTFFPPLLPQCAWGLRRMRLLNLKKKKEQETQLQKQALLSKKFFGCTLVSHVLQVVTPRRCALRHLLATRRLLEASSQSCPAGGLPVAQECLMTQSLPTYLWTITKPLFVQQPVKSFGLSFVEEKKTGVG